MKTHRHRVTGQHVPEWGEIISGRPNAKGTRFEIFERGKGHRKEAISKWEAVDIPDLSKGFSLSQFREHVKAYGIQCSIGFLDTCDYMKPKLGRYMMQDNYPDDETTAWFLDLFKMNPRNCYVSLLGVFGLWSFDLLDFEKHLASHFGYPIHADMSMEWFMSKTFGEANTERFKAAFLPVSAEKSVA